MAKIKSNWFKVLILTSACLTTFLSGCNSQQSSSVNAQQIHERVLTVDTHIDWPFRQHQDLCLRRKPPRTSLVSF